MKSKLFLFIEWNYDQNIIHMCFVRRLGYRKRNCYHMTMTCQNHPSLPLDRHLPRDYSQLPRDLDISQRYL